MRSCAMVVVAAGEGSRLCVAGLPKQYVKIHKQAVLWYSIVSSFAPYIHKVRVVIREGHDVFYQNAIKSLPSAITDRLLPPVYGGDRRQDSVRIGLESLDGMKPSIVVIHDACRPFAQAISESKVTDALTQHSGVVQTLPVVDTIKVVSDNTIVGSVDRETARIVQTPQVYTYRDVLACHSAVHRTNPYQYFTDDSSVMLECGMSVAVVEGSRNNFKITTAEDILQAELHLSSVPHN